MKKLICLFAFTSLFAVSCSDSDDNTENPGTTGNRLVKEIDTYEDGTSTTYDFNYNGGKLASIEDSDGGNIVVTYSGDLVTKMEYYEDTTLTQTDLYEYNSDNKLATFTMLSHDVEWGDKEVYVYNADGTVSMTHYIGDLDSQTQFNDEGVITFMSNGEIASMGASPTSMETYQYDDKNNPFKNMVGFDKIAFANGTASGINHNMTLLTENFGGSTINTTTTFTYNTANYPVTSSEDYDGEITTSEYFYE